MFVTYDIYLGGISEPTWRKYFKSKVSSKHVIFDPYVPNYKKNKSNVDDLHAKQWYHLENDNRLTVFYVNDKWSGASTLLEIGDCVGRNKQIIVCLEGNVVDREKICRYCEFRGVMITESIDDLVQATETFLSELSNV